MVFYVFSKFSNNNLFIFLYVVKRSMIKLRGFSLKLKIFEVIYSGLGKTFSKSSIRGCIIEKKQPQEKSLANFYDNNWEIDWFL